MQRAPRNVVVRALSAWFLEMAFIDFSGLIFTRDARHPIALSSPADRLEFYSQRDGKSTLGVALRGFPLHIHMHMHTAVSLSGAECPVFSNASGKMPAYIQSKVPVHTYLYT